MVELKRPLWFVNMLSCFDWRLEGDYESYLGALVYWSSFVNNYLDKTLVKGNAEAQAVVDLNYRLYLRFADFLVLRLTEEDSKSIHKLYATFKRLDGLTTLPKPVRKGKK